MDRLVKLCHVVGSAFLLLLLSSSLSSLCTSLIVSAKAINEMH